MVKAGSKKVWAGETCTAKRQYRSVQDMGEDLTCRRPAKARSATGEPRCGMHSDEACAARAARRAAEQERIRARLIAASIITCTLCAGTGKSIPRGVPGHASSKPCAACNGIGLVEVTSTSAPV